MEHARKMVLVPEDSVKQLPTTSTYHDNAQQYHEVSHSTDKDTGSVQTTGTTLSRLDNEMSNILSSNNYENDREKWSAYYQVLQRYLHIVGNERHNFLPPIETTNKEIFDDEKNLLQKKNDLNNSILDSLPKKYRKNASKLLNRLKKLPDSTFSWDHRGVVSINNHVIPDSNIVDLVNYSTRKRKNTLPPTGHRLFATILQSEQIPREYAGNPEVWMASSTPARHNVRFNASESTEEYQPTSLNSTENTSVEHTASQGGKRRRIVSPRRLRKRLRDRTILQDGGCITKNSGVINSQKKIQRWLKLK